ncbi:MAG: hypothetical protein IID34_09200 [Planctomycetes bacterium]|nr:hypothetical protein [Planctomycetota bacterium]
MKKTDMKSDHPFDITYTLIGRQGKIGLTATCPGSDPVTFRVNILDESERTQAKVKLQAAFPALVKPEYAEPLESKLAEIARSVVEELNRTGKHSDKAGSQTKPARASREQLLADLDKQAEQALAETPDAIRSEAEDMLADPNLIDLVLADIETCGVVGEQEFALTIYLLGTSRLLDNPLAGIVQGLSSTGKSFVPDQVSLLFPGEAKMKATDMTAEALYYLPTGTLMHRFVVAGERSRKQDDTRAETTRALREMLSSRELNKVVTISPNRKQEAVQIWQPGPIAYCESTTSTTIFDEDANRCLLLASDESSDQTRRIVFAKAKRAAGQSSDVTQIILKHHAAQRMLRRVRIRIPYAPALAAVFPVHRPQARRAINHAFDMIGAVALLHQRQRASCDLGHGDTIEAAEYDYVVARRQLIDPLGRALGGDLTPAAANFGKRLRDRYGADVFTSTDATNHDPMLNSRGKVNEHLRTLADSGAAECIETAKGSKPAKWKMIGDVPKAGAVWLPTLDELRSAIATVTV